MLFMESLTKIWPTKKASHNDRRIVPSASRTIWVIFICSPFLHPLAAALDENYLSFPTPKLTSLFRSGRKELSGILSNVSDRIFDGIVPQVLDGAFDDINRHLVSQQSHESLMEIPQYREKFERWVAGEEPKEFISSIRPNAPSVGNNLDFLPDNNVEEVEVFHEDDRNYFPTNYAEESIAAGDTANEIPLPNDDAVTVEESRSDLPVQYKRPLLREVLIRRDRAKFSGDDEQKMAYRSLGTNHENHSDSQFTGFPPVAARSAEFKRQALRDKLISPMPIVTLPSHYSSNKESGENSVTIRRLSHEESLSKNGLQSEGKAAEAPLQEDVHHGGHQNMQSTSQTNKHGEVSYSSSKILDHEIVPPDAENAESKAQAVIRVGNDRAVSSIHNDGTRSSGIAQFSNSPSHDNKESTPPQILPVQYPAILPTPSAVHHGRHIASQSIDHYPNMISGSHLEGHNPPVDFHGGFRQVYTSVTPVQHNATPNHYDTNLHHRLAPSIAQEYPSPYTLFQYPTQYNTPLLGAVVKSGRSLVLPLHERPLIREAVGRANTVIPTVGYRAGEIVSEVEKQFHQTNKMMEMNTYPAQNLQGQEAFSYTNGGESWKPYPGPKGPAYLAWLNEPYATGNYLYKNGTASGIEVPFQNATRSLQSVRSTPQKFAHDLSDVAKGDTSEKPQRFEIESKISDRNTNSVSELGSLLNSKELSDHNSVCLESDKREECMEKQKVEEMLQRISKLRHHLHGTVEILGKQQERLEYSDRSALSSFLDLQQDQLRDQLTKISSTQNTLKSMLEDLDEGHLPEKLEKNDKRISKNSFKYQTESVPFLAIRTEYMGEIQPYGETMVEQSDDSKRGNMPSHALATNDYHSTGKEADGVGDTRQKSFRTKGVPRGSNEVTRASDIIPMAEFGVIFGPSSLPTLNSQGDITPVDDLHHDQKAETIDSEESLKVSRKDPSPSVVSHWSTISASGSSILEYLRKKEGNEKESNRGERVRNALLHEDKNDLVTSNDLRKKMMTQPLNALVRSDAIESRGAKDEEAEPEGESVKLATQVFTQEAAEKDKVWESTPVTHHGMQSIYSDNYRTLEMAVNDLKKKDMENSMAQPGRGTIISTADIDLDASMDSGMQKRTPEPKMDHPKKSFIRQEMNNFTSQHKNKVTVPGVSEKGSGNAANQDQTFFDGVIGIDEKPYKSNHELFFSPGVLKNRFNDLDEKFRHRDEASDAGGVGEYDFEKGLRTLSPPHHQQPNQMHELVNVQKVAILDSLFKAENASMVQEAVGSSLRAEDNNGAPITEIARVGQRVNVDLEEQASAEGNTPENDKVMISQGTSQVVKVSPSQSDGGTAGTIEGRWNVDWKNQLSAQNSEHRAEVSRPDDEIWRSQPKDSQSQTNDVLQKVIEEWKETSQGSDFSGNKKLQFLQDKTQGPTFADEQPHTHDPSLVLVTDEFISESKWNNFVPASLNSGASTPYSKIDTLNRQYKSNSTNGGDLYDTEKSPTESSKRIVPVDDNESQRSVFDYKDEGEKLLALIPIVPIRDSLEPMLEEMMGSLPADIVDVGVKENDGRGDIFFSVGGGNSSVSGDDRRSWNSNDLQQAADLSPPKLQSESLSASDIVSTYENDNHVPSFTKIDISVPATFLPGNTDLSHALMLPLTLPATGMSALVDAAGAGSWSLLSGLRKGWWNAILPHSFSESRKTNEAFPSILDHPIANTKSVSSHFTNIMSSTLSKAQQASTILGDELVHNDDEVVGSGESSDAFFSDVEKIFGETTSVKSTAPAVTSASRSIVDDSTAAPSAATEEFRNTRLNLPLTSAKFLPAGRTTVDFNQSQATKLIRQVIPAVGAVTAPTVTLMLGRKSGENTNDRRSLGALQKPVANGKMSSARHLGHKYSDRPGNGERFARKADFSMESIMSPSNESLRPPSSSSAQSAAGISQEIFEKVGGPTKSRTRTKLHNFSSSSIPENGLLKRTA